MISFENVSKHYDSIVAVDDVSCVFEGGKTHVLLGSSGCGKTTLLRLILGLIAPDQGWVRVDGRAMSSLTRDELVAEMGTEFLCGHCGIENSVIDNSATYIAGWLQRLRNDTAAIGEPSSQFVVSNRLDDSVSTTCGTCTPASPPNMAP